MTPPLVAIVGRPNVGKSTLYNRLVGGRPALVHDTPGLTRDRRYGEVEYFGHNLRLVDTGGLDPEAKSDVVGAGIHRQAWVAIGEADLVMLVVDATAGITTLDREIAQELRKSGKPIVLCANKVDSAKRDLLAAELWELGIGEPFPVSAAHGRGIDALLEHVTGLLPGSKVEAKSHEPGWDDVWGGDHRDQHDDEDDGDDQAEDLDKDPNKDDEARPIRVAFVGKPNAGKSSLTNRLLGEERSLVHDVPGTTTDPIDTPFTLGQRSYVLVDTAGIRRKAKVHGDVEKLAVTMALGQIQRADVCVLVIDSTEAPSEQDAHLAGAIEDAGRALVICLNKSDLIRGEQNEALKQTVADTFHFLSWAQVVSTSAARGQGVDRLMDAVDRVAAEHRRRIPTAELNRFFAEVCEITPPPIHRGLPVRIHYITQGTSRPPTFILWANHPKGVSHAYRRFLKNQLRKRYGFKGTPLRVFVKEKSGGGTKAGD